MLKVDKLLSAARKVAKPLQKATQHVKEAVAPTATVTSEVHSIGGRPKHLQKRPKPISTGVVYRNLDKHSKFQQKFKEIKESSIVAQGFTKLDPNPLEQQVLLDPQRENIEIPRLAHGLERVIKNAGLHPVRHNKKLNFSPFLHKIHPPETINFNAVPQFITSSRDETLHRLATQFDCKYKGSTSSVSSLLSHLYYLLSKFKPVNLSPLSPAFHSAASSFTPAAVKPAIVIVRPKDGVWSIDAEHGNKTPDNQILLELGKSLERMFTMTQEEFESKMLKKTESAEDSAASAQNMQKEAYIYSKMGSFLFRSQLDCRWPYESEQQHKHTGHKHHHANTTDAPATPPVLRTFDLKSRAAWPIRIDCENYRLHLFYRPRTVAGLENSFEREFYDMVRAAFLKYIFQARIGKMEGIFVAYHNTTELLGFEYIPLREMEQYIFDTPAMADLSFDVTTKLLQLVLNAATKKCPNAPFRLSLHTKITPQGALDTMIGVEPLSNDRGWQEAEARDTNAFQINTPFYLFKLSLETAIDGKFTTGPFLCRTRDNVNIYYRLQEITADPATMMQTYMGMLKASQLFFIEEEE